MITRMRIDEPFDATNVEIFFFKLKAHEVRFKQHSQLMDWRKITKVIIEAGESVVSSDNCVITF